MNRVALSIAVACAAAGCAVLWMYIQRFEQSTAGGEQIPVLTVKRSVPIGERLAEDDLAVRLIPEAYLEERHVRASERNSVVGVRLANRLRPDEAVLWTDLSTAGANSRNLASLVQPGQRAVSLPATAASMFGGLLRPGDSVDAILTTERGVTGERVTILLAQNLLVLAVGADTGGDTDGRSSRSNRSNVTVAVSLDQAQMLTLALDHGAVSLALRNPDDPRVDAAPAMSTENMLRGANAQAMATVLPPGSSRTPSKARPTADEASDDDGDALADNGDQGDRNDGRKEASKGERNGAEGESTGSRAADGDDDARDDYERSQRRDKRKQSRKRDKKRSTP